jgi:hypothetical protein
MTHPDDDVLAAIALGDPAPSEVADHVRGCASCTESLASLRATVSTLRAPVDALLVPPASVWDAVTSEIDGNADGTWSAGDGAAATQGGRPAAVPAPAHDTEDDLAARRTARGDDRSPSPRRRIPVAWVAGAAAAGLVVGVAGARLLDRADPAPAAVTVASTNLDTLDTQQVKGSAEVVNHDGTLDLAVRTEAIDPGDGYLEVWLLNEDGKRMVSVGVLEPGRTEQSFTIPRELLDEGYLVVDISREGFDDAPQHSGDSVVRGTLAT